MPNYAQDFESTAVGALPPYWVNVGGATYAVTATSPESGARSLAGAGGNQIVIVSGTGAPTFADAEYRWSFRTTAGSGGLSSYNLIYGVDGTAPTRGYKLRRIGDDWYPYQYASDGSIAQFAAQGSDPYAEAAGDDVHVCVRVVGTQHQVKHWVGTAAEPSTFACTFTASGAIVAGFFGFENLFGESGPLDRITVADLAQATYTTATAVTAGLFLAPNVWRTVGTTAQSAAAGPYQILNVSGTTRVALTLDVSGWAAAFGATGNWPALAVKVDDALDWTILPVVNGSPVLATGLSTGAHRVHWAIDRLGPTADDWTGPASALKVVGYALDGGGTISAPRLRAGRGLIVGDSITAGYFGRSGGYVGNSIVGSYGWRVMESLDCEFGVDGRGGTGWLNGGNGNVPQTSAYWLKYDANTSKLVGGALPTPLDHLIFNVGTNGGDGGATEGAAMVAVLATARTVAPAARIGVCLPFGGFKRNTLSTAFAGWTDPGGNSVLIDLGADGIAYTGAPVYSFDGLHPSDAGARMLAVRVYHKYLSKRLLILQV